MAKRKPKEKSFPAFYIMDEEGNPVPTDDIVMWVQEKALDMSKGLASKTSVGIEKITGYVDGKAVSIGLSTAFMWFDEGKGQDEPKLFETATIAMPLAPNNECIVRERYATRQAAIEGHQRWREIIYAEIFGNPPRQA